MGLFGSKKGLVGVDIGSSAVKAVELKVGGKGGDEYQLLNIGLEPLPPEAIVDGAHHGLGCRHRCRAEPVPGQPDQDHRMCHRRLRQRGDRQEDQPSGDERGRAGRVDPLGGRAVHPVRHPGRPARLRGGRRGSHGGEHGRAARGRQERQDQRVHLGDPAGRAKPDDRGRRRLRPAELLRDQLRPRPGAGGGAAQHRRLHHERQRGAGWLLGLQPRYRGGRKPVHGRHPERPQPVVRAGGVRRRREFPCSLVRPRIR